MTHRHPPSDALVQDIVTEVVADLGDTDYDSDSGSYSDPGSGTGSETEPRQSLEQVREILFGSQARAHEERLAALEGRVGERLAQLAEDVDNVKSYIKNELTSLVEKVGAQREERMAFFQQLREELEAQNERFELRLAELSGKIERVEGGVQNLRRDAVLRAPLSDALTDVALRLAEGPAAPDTGELEPVGQSR